MLDVKKLLHSINELASEKRVLAEAFVDPESSRWRYVLGRNEHAASLCRSIEMTGVIDDFAPPGMQWNGLPMMKGSEVPPQAIVINCALSISPVSAARRLSELRIAGVLSLADLCQAFPGRFALPDFVRQTREDLVTNGSHWERLAGALEDAESKKVLNDVLKFRVSADYVAMSGYTVRLREQYFETFLGLSDEEVFVDAGGFDGDTAEEFCSRFPGYRSVLLFEPSDNNMQKAWMRLKDHRDIQFFALGLSDAVGTLFFNPDAGPASAVGDVASGQIAVTTLDQQVREKVSFIKMDLEGWEMKALAGSQRHIREDHPRLAIAVYHHPADFWRVFEFVRNVHADYKVFLRHYTEGWSETVMYFVPKDKTAEKQGSFLG